MPLKPNTSIVFNLRWHRRIGLSILLMVIFLAITGILLNHSPGIGLSKTTLKSPWLMDWYGFQTASFKGFQIKSSPDGEQQWLSHLGGYELFLNTTPVANCEAPLMGAATTATALVALCKDELVLLTHQGEFIEKLSVISGLPEHTTKLQVQNETLFILSNKTTMQLNLESFQVQPSKAAIKNWSEASPLPKQLMDELTQQADLPGVSLETLILDLHSGRFFGTAGVWFVDLVGLLICILALTGLWSWYGKYRIKRRHS